MVLEKIGRQVREIRDTLLNNKADIPRSAQKTAEFLTERIEAGEDLTLNKTFHCNKLTSAKLTALKQNQERPAADLDVRDFLEKMSHVVLRLEYYSPEGARSSRIHNVLVFKDDQQDVYVVFLDDRAESSSKKVKVHRLQDTLDVIVNPEYKFSEEKDWTPEAWNYQNMKIPGIFIHMLMNSSVEPNNSSRRDLFNTYIEGFGLVAKIEARSLGETDKSKKTVLSPKLRKAFSAT